MAVSTYVGLERAIEWLTKLDPPPRRVLDVGVGFGLWGFLLRTYLDVYHWRVSPEAWQVEIVGIDATADYLAQHHSVYSWIQTGTAQDLIERLGRFDLIVFGDVLEHMPRLEAERVLQVARCISGHRLIRVPLGSGWQRGPAPGLPFEAHVSQWEAHDFEPHMIKQGNGYVTLSDIRLAPCGLSYGIFLE